MKSTAIAVLAALMLSVFQAKAQDDWANIGRYEKANSEVTVQPKDEENGLPEKWSYDGVHLNSDGYDIIEDIILKALD